MRAASPADLDTVYQFETLCFQEHRFREEHVDWILRNPRALTLLEDGPDGVTAAMMLLFEGRMCRVLSIAVAPDVRRRHVPGLVAVSVHRFWRYDDDRELVDLPGTGRRVGVRRGHDQLELGTGSR